MSRIAASASSLLLCFPLVFALSASAAPASATPESKSDSAADAAWQDFTSNLKPVTPPAAWQTAQPTPEEIEKFKATEGERVAKSAVQARDFQTRFPKSEHLDEAKAREYELLQMASQLGNTNGLSRLDAIETAKLADPKLPENERVQLRLGAINRRAMSKIATDRAAAFDEVEKGARALQKDFPKRPESYEMLMAVAGELPPEKAKVLAKELSESQASDQVKTAAKTLLKKMERMGKPVPIKFAAVDGRAVDLEQLHGKVVLVDFWATWCGPCVREIPNVRATYDKLHPKGFEIVGISFDQDKEKLKSFVEQQKMPWPQYFDGKQWENVYGKTFDIQSIPTMWLVDKKGNLRDFNGREDLANKVEKLLAENP